MDQLELFGFSQGGSRLTVAEALDILWRGHLSTKPSSRTFHSNRVALVKSFGHLPICAINEIHITQHMEARLKGLNGFARVGAQSVRHDLQIFTLLLSTFKRWKRKGIAFDGIDFSTVELPEESPLADIKRPKAQRREILVRPLEFSKLIERSSERMAACAFFAIDTGMNECDLRTLKVKDCDLNENVLRFVRQKTRNKISKLQVLPLSPRCRALVVKAEQEGRELVLDWTNHINEWRRLRFALAIRYQWRDLRKTFGNEIHRRTKSVTRMQKALCHASPRTTIDHYLVDDGGDLKNPVRHVSDTFHGGRTE